MRTTEDEETCLDDITISNVDDNIESRRLIRDRRTEKSEERTTTGLRSSQGKVEPRLLSKTTTTASIESRMAPRDHCSQHQSRSAVGTRSRGGRRGHHSRHPHHSSHHHRRSDYSLRLHQSDEEFSYISPCVKYSLFLLNLAFWVIGGSCVGLGTWSFLEESSQLSMIRVQNVKDIIFNISLALVFLGIIVFSMSFAGCLGALRENLCLLKLYSLMLLILFIGEILLSTVAFVFPNSLSHYLKESLSKDPLMKYRDDANLQNLIDVIQRELKCCGISDGGYKDWSQNIYFNCTPTNPSPEKCAVPYSCCRNPRNFDSGLINSMCGYNVQNISSIVEVNKYIYTRGCVEALTEFIERNMNIVAGVCLGSALIQLLAMFSARSLQGQIMAQRARWM